MFNSQIILENTLTYQKSSYIPPNLLEMTVLVILTRQLNVCLFVCLFVFLSVCLSVCLSGTKKVKWNVESKFAFAKC